MKKIAAILVIPLIAIVIASGCTSPSTTGQFCTKAELDEVANMPGLRDEKIAMLSHACNNYVGYIDLSSYTKPIESQSSPHFYPDEPIKIICNTRQLSDNSGVFLWWVNLNPDGSVIDTYMDTRFNLCYKYQ